MKNYCLALSGGGARGAYEAGALLELAKHDINFDHVSGTSVGVLNGAYYVQSDGSYSDMLKLCEVWKDFANSDIIKLNYNDAWQYLSEFLKVSINIKNKSSDNNEFSILDFSVLQNKIDNFLDYEKIIASDKKLIISAIVSTSAIDDIIFGAYREPKYFYSNELSKYDLRQAIFAAISIPLLFKSTIFQGKRYSDAGLSVPIPSEILYQNGVRKILSIFLDDYIIQNRFDYKDCNLLQIRPSETINKSLYSMIDFSLKHILDLIELGKKDVNSYFSKINDFIKDIDESTYITSIIVDKIKNLPDINKKFL